MCSPPQPVWGHLPCSVLPDVLGPNCSDREEEDWCVILRVTFGLPILTFVGFVVVVFIVCEKSSI